jgi:transcriptional regulator with XRE-family HTH domain
MTCEVMVATTQAQYGGRMAAHALLRDWRTRRRMSQQEVSDRCGVSTRHLSYVETGRSTPSPELVLLLAETFDVPLRERNNLLVAAGHAPRYHETSWDAPGMAEARQAVEQYLAALEPAPAVAVDRMWNLVSGNAAVGIFMEGVAPELLLPIPNVIRLTLHPDGLQPRVVNFDETATEVLRRLDRQVALTGDGELARLLEEVSQYPGVPAIEGIEEPGAIFLPIRMMHEGTELAFVSAITTFGTAVDISLAELAIETFMPADAVTRQRLVELQ